MSSPHDSLAPQSDSIDPARACDVVEAGFYLIDDGGGRFIVDREFGIVSLKDETLLQRERGAVHSARLRVIEPSGANYELELRLRLTGRVPQVVGGEDFGAIAAMARDLADQIAASAPTSMSAPAAAATSWTRYAAALGVHGKADLLRTRRAFISAELPATMLTDAALSLAEPPPAVGARSPWSL